MFRHGHVSARSRVVSTLRSARDDSGYAPVCREHRSSRVADAVFVARRVCAMRRAKIEAMIVVRALYRGHQITVDDHRFRHIREEYFF